MSLKDYNDDENVFLFIINIRLLNSALKITIAS
jgi:hypothetical protein